MLGILNGYCQENIFHKVKFLRLQCFDETPTILLDDFHTIFPNLERIQVRNSSYETLFPNKGTTCYQIRKLWLFDLEKIEHIWQEDFPLDHPLFQFLEDLHVVNCPCLTSLVPSSTSFTNLTHLKVDNCKELIYMITISTAKSLVQLKALEITNCEKMLDVVKIDDEEKAEENIVFENLEYLEFTSLSSLRNFCSGKQTFIFPSLFSFIVKGCPQMKIFSSALTIAPCLKKINVEEENMRWKGDLNTTIEQMFLEKVHNVIIIYENYLLFLFTKLNKAQSINFVHVWTVSMILIMDLLQRLALNCLRSNSLNKLKKNLVVRFKPATLHILCIVYTN